MNETSEGWFPIPLRPPVMIEYECPVCRLVEKVTEYVETPMHRHRYGDGKLQTGLVVLWKRRKG